MDSLRIPPEKLLFNKPESYDRILLTKDIEGFYLFKYFLQELRQEKNCFSLKFMEIHLEYKIYKVNI